MQKLWLLFCSFNCQVTAKGVVMYQVLSGSARVSPCKPPNILAFPICCKAYQSRRAMLCVAHCVYILYMYISEVAPRALFLPRWVSTGSPCVDAGPATGRFKCIHLHVRVSVTVSAIVSKCKCKTVSAPSQSLPQGGYLALYRG